MSTYHMKDNAGSLFKNDRREKDTHPHAKGSVVIDGVDYWIDAWTNTDKNGNKYQSLKFKRKEQSPVQGFGQRDQQHRQNLGNGGFAPPPSDLDDDLPF